MNTYKENYFVTREDQRRRAFARGLILFIMALLTLGVLINSANAQGLSASNSQRDLQEMQVIDPAGPKWQFEVNAGLLKAYANGAVSNGDWEFAATYWVKDSPVDFSVGIIGNLDYNFSEDQTDFLFGPSAGINFARNDEGEKLLGLRVFYEAWRENVGFQDWKEDTWGISFQLNFLALL